MGQPYEGQGKALYVGNLSANVNEGMLAEMFNQVGPLQDVKIIRDKTTNQSAGYGFVRYQHAEHANHAMTYNGRHFFGQVSLRSSLGAQPSLCQRRYLPFIHVVRAMGCLCWCLIVCARCATLQLGRACF